MGIEVLLTLIKGAGSLATVRTLLFEPSFVERAANAMAAVSEEAAARLFKEAVDLPPREQEATLNQVTLLLEIAVTASDPTRPEPLWSNSRKRVHDIQHHIEQLMWLTTVYRIMGHHAKADDRVERIRVALDELREAMDWDVHIMIFSPRTRTGIDVPLRQEAREQRYSRKLDDLNRVCDSLAVLV